MSGKERRSGARRGGKRWERLSAGVHCSVFNSDRRFSCRGRRRSSPERVRRNPSRADLAARSQAFDGAQAVGLVNRIEGFRHLPAGQDPLPDSRRARGACKLTLELRLRWGPWAIASVESGGSSVLESLAASAAMCGQISRCRCKPAQRRPKQHQRGWGRSSRVILPAPAQRRNRR